jgi:hypothetical protein
MTSTQEHISLNQEPQLLPVRIVQTIDLIVASGLTIKMTLF